VGRWILIVEDNAPMAEALRDILGGEGYEVAVARDGAVALDWLAAHPRPDLILLDLMMPTMDGYELRARQLADPALAAIPTFVISAGPFDERFEAMRVDGWLRKPVALDSLLAAVARHCPIAPAGAVHRHHEVCFFASEEAWPAAVTPFVAEGLARGGLAFATATPSHGARLRAALAEHGFDVAELERSGQLVVGDAQQFADVITLPSGALDVETCRMAVGQSLEQALQTAAGRPVYCYGEPSSVLWQRGNREAAVQMERLWNELPQTSRVSALCAYHADAEAAAAPPYADVRAAHSAVV
jgi:two-component system chemotaxis response regulator CheY